MLPSVTSGLRGAAGGGAAGGGGGGGGGGGELERDPPMSFP